MAWVAWLCNASGAIFPLGGLSGYSIPVIVLGKADPTSPDLVWFYTVLCAQVPPLVLVGAAVTDGFDDSPDNNFMCG